MRVILLSSILLMYSALICFGQSTNAQVEFNPSYPEKGGQLSITYFPKDSAMAAAKEIYCLLYVAGIDKKNQAQGVSYPKVYEPDMKLEGAGWRGEVLHIPVFATSLTVIFTDSLGHFDNNRGEGYWTPVYKDGVVIPGALSGIADMHAGAWDPKACFGLNKDLSFAKKLFEEDFRLHPEMKRDFIRSYMNTININDSESKKLFVSLLEEYASYSDLTEWDLLHGISANYVKINDIKSAEKYKQLVFQKFPKGSWSLQTNSLALLRDITESRDIQKQRIAYSKFLADFPEPYPDEFTRRVMTGRRGTMLALMAWNFSDNGAIEEWKREVENLKDDEFKAYAYSRAARYIIDESLKTNQQTKTSANLERNLTVYQMNSESNKLSDAESLATQTVSWWKENLDAPRRWIDQPFFTDRQILSAREGRLAEFLDQQGQLEALQNKFEEALETLQDAAVKFGKRQDPTINEHYIETMVKAGKRQEAIIEMEKVIALGKTTKRINELYSKIKNNEPEIADLKQGYYADLKKRLRNEFIHEQSPKLSLLDRNGNPVDSLNFQGKIIVLDFWASWCPPCMEGNAVLEEMAEKYKADKDIVFLFVNVDASKSRAAAIIKEKPSSLNYVFDKDNETVRKFMITALPSKIVINKKGKVNFKSVGLTGGRQEQADEIRLMIEMARESK